VSIKCTHPDVDYITLLEAATLTPIAASAFLLLVYALNCRIVQCFGNMEDCYGLTQRRRLKRIYFNLFFMFSFYMITGVSVVIANTFSCVNADPDHTLDQDSFYMRYFYSSL